MSHEQCLEREEHLEVFDDLQEQPSDPLEVGDPRNDTEAVADDPGDNCNNDLRAHSGDDFSDSGSALQETAEDDLWDVDSSNDPVEADHRNNLIENVCNDMEAAPNDHLTSELSDDLRADSGNNFEEDFHRDVEAAPNMWLRAGSSNDLRVNYGSDTEESSGNNIDDMDSSDAIMEVENSYVPGRLDTIKPGSKQGKESMDIRQEILTTQRGVGLRIAMQSVFLECSEPLEAPLNDGGIGTKSSLNNEVKKTVRRGRQSKLKIRFHGSTSPENIQDTPVPEEQGVASNPVDKLHDSADSQTLSEGDSKDDDEMAAPCITVQATRNHTTGRRVYDKMFPCYYCGVMRARLPRHHQLRHSGEAEVLGIQNEKDKGEKQRLMGLLRNKGVHRHNCKVIREGKGRFLVVYRPSTPNANYQDYGPCEFCWGYYLRLDLWKHRCFVKLKKIRYSNRLAATSKWLMPQHPQDFSASKLQEITSKFVRDDIRRVAERDPLIVEYASRLLSSCDGSNAVQRYSQVKWNMRAAGQLLLELRRRTKRPNASMGHFLHPGYFLDIVEEVQKMACFNERQGSYRKPSVALKMGKTLQVFALILQSYGVETRDEDLIKNARAFRERLQVEWDVFISPSMQQPDNAASVQQPDNAASVQQPDNAASVQQPDNAASVQQTDNATSLQQTDNAASVQQTNSAVERRKPTLVNLTEDMIVLRNLLKKMGRESLVTLQGESPDSKDAQEAWTSLAEVALAHITLFNRRRRLISSKILLHDLTMLNCLPDATISCTLSAVERELCTVLKRIEVRDRGTKVPVFLTDEMAMWIRTLVEKKDVTGSPENPFVFGRTVDDSVGHIEEVDVLMKFRQLCGRYDFICLPEAGLRDHLATVYQILNLDQTEMGMIAKSLRHDPRIDWDLFRLQNHALQTSKLVKLLISLDRGWAEFVGATKLDDDALSHEEIKSEEEEQAERKESSSISSSDLKRRSSSSVYDMTGNPPATSVDATNVRSPTSFLDDTSSSSSLASENRSSSSSVNDVNRNSPAAAVDASNVSSPSLPLGDTSRSSSSLSLEDSGNSPKSVDDSSRSSTSVSEEDMRGNPPKLSWDDTNGQSPRTSPSSASVEDKTWNLATMSLDYENGQSPRSSPILCAAFSTRRTSRTGENQMPRGKRAMPEVECHEERKKHCSSIRVHVPWSAKEKAAVYRHFQHLISRQSLPGKSLIDRCLQREPCLEMRSWRNVKDFVRNEIKRLSKK